MGVIEHDDAFWHNERAWADYLGAKPWNRRPLRDAPAIPAVVLPGGEPTRTHRSAVARKGRK